MRDALWLTKFELKRIGFKQVILFVALLGIVIYFIRSSIIVLEYQLDLGLDSIFIVALLLIPNVIRDKGFPTQKIAGSFYASPNLLHLQTLPVSKKAIALYRLFIQFVFASFLVLCLFASMYDLLKDEISMLNYVGWTFFWICLSTLIGRFNTNNEAGFDMYDSILRFIFSIALILTIYFSITFIWLPKGIVYWSFQLAQHHMMILNTISFIMLGLSFLATYCFTKKLKRTDYITSR